MNSLPPTSSPRGEPKGDVKTITLFDGGEFRGAENTITRELEAHGDDLAMCHLMLDFRRVGRISSVDLGTLILLHKRLAASGGRLTLFNLRDEIYEVFTVTRLHTVLEICREN